MTLDEQLRATLHARATALVPPADPFAGVERRARGIRRRRAAASLAGTALAVLAVAGAVPLLAPDRAGGPVGQATSLPSDGLELDLDDPWPLRGTLGEGEGAQTAQAWVASNPGTTFVLPLFARVVPGSELPQVVVAARTPAGDRWGVVAGSATGWDVVVDRELGPDPRALVAALPSGGVLVVAAPAVDDVQYADREGLLGRAGFARLAPGVALGGTPLGSGIEVVGRAAGVEVFRVPAPPKYSVPRAPANVVAAEPRGEVEPDLVLAARRAYALRRRVEPDAVQDKVVLAGGAAPGPRYLLGQFWVAGDDEADTLAVVGGPTDLSVAPQAPLAPDAPVALMALPPADPSSPGRLAAVPGPGGVVVQYAPRPGVAFAGSNTPYEDVTVLERSAAAVAAGTEQVRGLGAAGVVLGPVRVADLLCAEAPCG